MNLRSDGVVEYWSAGRTKKQKISQDSGSRPKEKGQGVSGMTIFAN
jgi:hypothetical protein